MPDRLGPEAVRDDDRRPRPAARAIPRGLALLQTLRPHQWVKNLLLFVPMVLDHKLFDGPTLAKAVTAFVAFCCAASSAYILNDILDRGGGPAAPDQAASAVRRPAR